PSGSHGCASPRGAGSGLKRPRRRRRPAVAVVAAWPPRPRPTGRPARRSRSVTLIEIPGPGGPIPVGRGQIRGDRPPELLSEATRGDSPGFPVVGIGQIRGRPSDPARNPL